MATSSVISKASVPLQFGLHGLRLFVSSHHRNDPVPAGNDSEEAQGLGSRTGWMLHHHLLLLYAMLLGVH